MPVPRSRSAISSPTDSHGVSEAPASWNTIWGRWPVDEARPRRRSASPGRRSRAAASTCPSRSRRPGRPTRRGRRAGKHPAAPAVCRVPADRSSQRLVTENVLMTSRSTTDGGQLRPSATGSTKRLLGVRSTWRPRSVGDLVQRQDARAGAVVGDRDRLGRCGRALVGASAHLGSKAQPGNGDTALGTEPASAASAGRVPCPASVATAAGRGCRDGPARRGRRRWARPRRCGRRTAPRCGRRSARRHRGRG